MKKIKRRNFIQAAGIITMTASCGRNRKAADIIKKKGVDTSADMPLGIIKHVTDPDKDLAYVIELGFSTCQLSVSDYSMEFARKLRDGLKKHEIAPTCLICMGPGKHAYNFYEGPLTIGLVPRELRAERVKRLEEGTDFCEKAGIPDILAHFGFIPENPNNVLYKEFIVTMKKVAEYGKERGISYSFETGQETPITLLRAILDIGTDNLGINYDTANLIMYGKANPVDGLDVVGKYVRSLHAKDGIYPTNPKELGKETPIGEGKVDFPAVIRRLKELKFKGHITIEREISGKRQVEDILKSKEFLENLIRTV